jgi:hypothetical protein
MYWNHCVNRPFDSCLSVCGSPWSNLAPIWRIFMTLYVGGVLLKLGPVITVGWNRTTETRSTWDNISPFSRHVQLTQWTQNGATRRPFACPVIRAESSQPWCLTLFALRLILIMSYGAILMRVTVWRSRRADTSRSYAIPLFLVHDARCSRDSCALLVMRQWCADVPWDAVGRRYTRTAICTIWTVW